MEMKFILIAFNIGGTSVKLLPVIFTKDLVHSVMFECSKLAIRKQFNKYNVWVVSAGFVNLDKNHYYGESETLNIKCHPSTNSLMETISYLNIFEEDALIEPIAIK